MIEFAVQYKDSTIYVHNHVPFFTNEVLTEMLNLEEPDLLAWRKDILKTLSSLVEGSLKENTAIDENIEKIFRELDSIFKKLPIYGCVFYHGQHEGCFEGPSDNDIEERTFMLLDGYLTFIDDLLRVKVVYSDFLDNYFHSENKFLNATSLAKKFKEFQMVFLQKDTEPYERFIPAAAQFFHSVLDEEKLILCKSYKFDSIGAFLYYDFFHGLEYNYVPKKCDNCGKYFLNKGGKYNNYCENPSPQDIEKTCRDVGAASRYQDKCKTDPVWQTYNRSYKTHYARYKKGKMTKDEFETWSGWAIEMRGKMERGEMTFEEYVEEIKR